jgi:hypothetical protein
VSYTTPWSSPFHIIYGECTRCAFSGKKFENVAKPRRKERTALIIPPESFELLATWRSMRKRKEKGITY